MTTDGVPPVLDGRYLVGTELGRGGAAVVHRAWDQVLQREVAVKILRQVLLDPAARARFSQEGQILARLDHPGLVPVYDAAMHEDHPFLVMEVVDGHSLAGTGRLPLPEVRRIGASVAAVLAYVHERGIAHRDVKPGNILVGADGRVRLADFGIARVLGSDHETATGTIVGTAAYLAPEQVRGEPADGAADVYSLGLVLLELLRGEPVYQGAPAVAALARLTTQPVVEPSWPAVLTAMTALDPAARPPAADVAARLTGGPDTAVLPVPRRGGRRALLAAGLAVPALAFGAFLLPGHTPAGTGASLSPAPAVTTTTTSPPAPTTVTATAAARPRTHRPVVRPVVRADSGKPKGNQGKGKPGKGNPGKGKGKGGGKGRG